MITIILVQNLAAKLPFITILGKSLDSSIRNTILANERIEILIQLVNIEELNAFSDEKIP